MTSESLTSLFSSPTCLITFCTSPLTSLPDAPGTLWHQPGMYKSVKLSTSESDDLDRSDSVTYFSKRESAKRGEGLYQIFGTIKSWTGHISRYPPVKSSKWKKKTIHIATIVIQTSLFLGLMTFCQSCMLLVSSLNQWT